MLSVCGFQILVDCPLDFSACTIFSPVPVDTYAVEAEGNYNQLDDRSLDSDKNCASYDEGSSSMHMEFQEFFGWMDSGFPEWLRWTQLEKLPFAISEIALGQDWRIWVVLGPYIVDVKDCMQKFRLSSMAKRPVIMAFSSGLEIGASNWIIAASEVKISCMSNSVFKSSHAMSFDYQALQGTRILVCSDTLPEDAQDDNHSLALMADDSMTSSVTCMNFIFILQKQEVLLSSSLEAFSHEVPIYIISSIAEELLAFTNIIPEWLCQQRQDKAYDMFLWTPKCRMEWMLIWLFYLSSQLPSRFQTFKPMLKMLQPKYVPRIALLPQQFPDDLKWETFCPENPFTCHYYSENETVPIPSLSSTELEIAAGLASQLQCKSLKQESTSIARLKGELIVEHGKYRLDSSVEPVQNSNLKPLLRWGLIDLKKLLAFLKEKGISGSVQGLTLFGIRQVEPVVRKMYANKGKFNLTSAKCFSGAAKHNMTVCSKDP
ncbi:hypothetical protein RJ641_001511, partial [Dillenia turbinata]